MNAKLEVPDVPTMPRNSGYTSLLAAFTAGHIHAIKAWSENPDDEAPLCGADKNDTSVWGNRTVAYEWTSCPGCRAAIAAAGGR